jgi:maltose/moltooligosaccharide transporter
LSLTAVWVIRYRVSPLKAQWWYCGTLNNINSLPMVVDTAASDADLGTYTGLYYIASQLAAVAGPTINGYIVEWGGGDYNLIFLATPAFFVLAILCMLGVTQGEAKQAAAIW